MGDVESLKKMLKTHSDFPKKASGIVFLDIFPIFRDPIAAETLITHFMHHLVAETVPQSLSKKVDVVVGLDARGFILAPILALRLGAAFVPVRKKGKLPGECVTATYEKEYGSVFYQDEFEMQADAIRPGQTIIIVDDLIATGGSAKAAGQLAAKLGGKVLEYLFIIELSYLKGSQMLDAPVYSMVKEDD
ncbi:uncharacterized protein FIBRA_07873 [Fibroporia radiculosa]|uniref:adenine phosphoribosyltransferase n=1 Tax=Fibroporia radiculosa TaxID=599839 RepID=J4GFS6_9APHY|nr:uncharacterized protein FIBRA_07873 [Fibroporia radiculosa]CCM05643.1 predicted protein [Fibroporia radiculosa]